ncbi:MAG: TfoX/Sxy family DNA transformation protein [Sumerlaeia bacterium]
MTPLEKARNIGPKCAAELEAVGIGSLEELRRMGWEVAYEIWTAAFPDRIHAMAAYALIGAVEDCNCLSLPEDLKRRARRATERMRAEKIA